MKTVRILFSKTGRAKYISHLDLNRTMTRVLRRAAIPLWYTEGFNRHPYITFAAPISLGFEGLREVMDFRLEEEMPFDEVTARLNAAMPEGLAVSECFEAQMKPGELTAAVYELYFDCPTETVRALLAQPEILVEKKTKKKELKIVDIRPAFADAAVTETENGTLLTVTLPCGSEGTVNPSLFISALQTASGEDISCRVVRTDLRGTDGKPFR